MADARGEPRAVVCVALPALRPPLIAVGVALGRFPFDALDYGYLSLGLIPLPFGVYYFARAMLVEIAVTNERFVYKTGLIAFRTEEIGLDNIETIEVEQSILGRLLGYGTITVRGTGSEYVKIRMVSDPVGLRRHIPMAPEDVGEPAQIDAEVGEDVGQMLPGGVDGGWVATDAVRDV